MVIQKFIKSNGILVSGCLYPAYDIMKNFDDSWGLGDFLMFGFGGWMASTVIIFMLCIPLAMIEESLLKCPKCKKRGNHKELEKYAKAYSTCEGLWQCCSCKHNWYPGGSPEKGVECPKCNRKGGTFYYDELVRDIHKSPPNSYPTSTIETFENCFKCSYCGHDFLSKDIEQEDQEHKNN